MTAWEYKTLRYSPSSTSGHMEMPHEANEMGRDGWELVTSSASRDRFGECTVLWFKRPKSAAADVGRRGPTVVIGGRKRILERTP